MKQEAKDGGPEDRLEAARAARSAGDLGHALDHLKEAFKRGLDPSFAVELVYLAREFMERELWREAEEALLEALRVAPENEEARRALADLHDEPDRFLDVKGPLGKDRIAARRRRTVLSSVPRVQLFLEITNACNGRCATCLNRSMKRPRGVMAFDLFRRLVDESLDTLYLDTVHLYGVGETFLAPRAMDYLDYAVARCHERGIRTCLITNGERVTDIPAGISVLDISFNAGRKETYERITGISFDRTVENLRRLHRAGRLDARSRIHMLVFEDNREEVEDFKRLFSFTGAELMLAYKYDNQCGKIEDKTLPEYRPAVGWETARIPCHYVRDVINVAWNGDVILCPHDFEGEVTYGNVAEASLVEIWESERHRAVLAAHARRRFEGLCARCNFNLPMEGTDVVVSKEERIALRKRHAADLRNDRLLCERAPECPILARYFERMDEIEGMEGPIVPLCSTDPRFYGIEAVLDPGRHPFCPGLRRCRRSIASARVTWEAPVFGPSGYAFAARGYALGLAEVGAAVRLQPVWGDCTVEFEEGEGIHA